MIIKWIVKQGSQSQITIIFRTASMALGPEVGQQNLLGMGIL